MKTNLDSLFKTNTDYEKDGIRFEINKDLWFHLRRMGGANDIRGQKALDKHSRPYTSQIKNDSLDPAIEKEITYKVFFDACVVEWGGVEFDGKEAECSMENTLKLFKALPELYRTLRDYTLDQANYKDEELGNF